MKKESKRFGDFKGVTRTFNIFLKIYFAVEYAQEETRLKYILKSYTLRLLVPAYHIEKETGRGATAKQIASITNFHPKSIYTRLKSTVKSSLLHSPIRVGLKWKPKGYFLSYTGFYIGGIFFSTERTGCESI